MVLMHHVS